MKSFTLCFILSVFTLILHLESNTQTLQWYDKKGPWNLRDIKDISVGTYPPTGNLIYLATTYDGLLKSSDDGNTWITLLPIRNFNAVACERFNPDVIYASKYEIGDGNFYKSTNGGISFFIINSGITNLDIKKISISPFDHERILIGCNSYDGEIPTLFLTTNGGNSWQVINYNGIYDNQSITDIEWSKKKSECSFSFFVY